MKGVDKSVDLMALIRGKKSPAGLQTSDDVTGFKILRVATSEPDPFTFVFEGTQQALDFELFEIPVNCYPLAVGDRFLVFPIAGHGMRWAVFSKLNQGTPVARVISTKELQVEGIGRTYGAADLIYPPGGTLPTGKYVSLQPTYVGGKIKYVVLQTHEGV